MSTRPGAPGNATAGDGRVHHPDGRRPDLVVLGPLACRQCEEAVLDGLAACRECGATPPLDAAAWTPWAVAGPKTPTPLRHKILLWPGCAVLSAGAVVMVLTLAGAGLGVLSAGSGEALGWLAWILIGAGLALILTGLILLGLLGLLRRVATATGITVDAAHDAARHDDLTAPEPTGPSWRILSPQCSHVVQLGDPGRRPEQVWCDGSPVGLTWADGADAPGPFTLDDHTARFSLEAAWDAGAVAGVAFALVLAISGGAGGGAASPARYRWRLAVD